MHIFQYVLLYSLDIAMRCTLQWNLDTTNFILVFYAVTGFNKNAVLMLNLFFFCKVTSNSQVKMFCKQVENAERFGASGIILYSDPSDFNINITEPYPDSWWLPPTGIQRGSIAGDGDYQTPLYPSTCEHTNSF